MKITKEDLQYIRRYVAEQGKEMTPDQVLEVMREVKKIEVIDEPGLVTLMRQNGNLSTGRTSERPEGPQ